MSSLCYRCGSSEFYQFYPRHHPRILYWITKKLGYRVVRCAGCRRLRIVRRLPVNN
jgi:DUF438 domain-containing protein